jgi:hypothetical protein
LEGQITIIIEATSHENDRRGRCELHVGRQEPRDFFSRPLAHAISLKLTEAAEIPRGERPTRD